jgi:hypothetical protein
MRIHALRTGSVRLKHAFLFPHSGVRRQLGLFLPGPWSDPMPIHCWAVEHAGRLLLVDTGETATVRDVPFARFEVEPEQELPGALAAAGLSFDGPPFGAFARSCPLSDDARVVAVPTSGHTPGHMSVICVDDQGRHVMLAGDATDSLEQLRARRADAIAPDPRVHVQTLETILAHCAQHPTVYLPSHDPESAQRLAGSITVG